VQAPDGVSNETTLAINRKVAEVCDLKMIFLLPPCLVGPVLDGNAPNKGLFFFGTKHWDERQGSEHSVAAIVERLNKKLLMSIDGGRVFVVEPPSIPGYGAGGGFEFQLLDQSSGAYGLNQFFASAGQIMQAGNSNPILNRVYTLFSPESPQIEIKVNREKMASLGLILAPLCRLSALILVVPMSMTPSKRERFDASMCRLMMLTEPPLNSFRLFM
jgi:HAE1 family hydrophobic/amphiphilic exporter-1